MNNPNQVTDPVVERVNRKWSQQCTMIEACERVFGTNNHHLSNLRDESFKSNLNEVIRHAAVTFAATGAKLDIDENRVFDGMDRHTRSDRAKLEDFYAIWNNLAQKYGGGKGQHLALVKAANDLASTFGMFREQPKFSQGCLVLTTSVWPDTYLSKKTLSTNSRCAFEKTLTHLATFAEHIGDSVQAKSIMALGSRFQSWQDKLVLREKLEAAGSGAGHSVVITTYISKFEFKLGPALSEQFQIFIAEYATRLKEEMA
ncbi:MAG: hypothetical protein LW865_01970 [Betaproteobacteria bacterium]|jgi:hypothetical protein|nr:hypothetical protein [Betaproteobacteria bacterium]